MEQLYTCPGEKLMNKFLKVLYPIAALTGVLVLVYKKFKSEDENFLIKEREQLEQLYKKYGSEAVDIYHRIMGDD